MTNREKPTGDRDSVVGGTESVVALKPTTRSGTSRATAAAPGGRSRKGIWREHRDLNVE